MTRYIEKIMAIVQNAVAASEQSVTAESISLNVEEMAGVACETAAGAGQSQITAHSVNGQAEILHNIIRRFTRKS